jgi:hypothetical protein
MKKWTEQQIKTARQTEIKPLLEKLGHRFVYIYDDNYNLLNSTHTIVVKKHYWQNREEQTGGNAIDLLTNHFGYTFAEAMDLLLGEHATAE